MNVMFYSRCRARAAEVRVNIAIFLDRFNNLWLPKSFEAIFHFSSHKKINFLFIYLHQHTYNQSSAILINIKTCFIWSPASGITSFSNPVVDKPPMEAQ